MNSSLTRRTFLKAAGFTIAIAITPSGDKILSAKESEEAMGKGFSPSVWLRIMPDNTVVITLNKSHMGEGVCTSLPMIIAEELEIEWWTALASEEAAEAFLGTQGDPCDTQCDMFLAGCGAVAAQFLFERMHDRQIAAVDPAVADKVRPRA